jgi:pimeloyl-ACP methyl ester carboxylesterase
MRLALIVALGLVVPVAHAQELLTVEARPGAAQSYLLLAPAGAPPRAAAVLLPGGTGNIRLRVEDSIIKFGPNNFLVRARNRFVRGGVAVALVDTPSDQARGMTNAFRKGESHARDLGAVVADLRKRYPAAPIFLVGTSMGSVSAAYAGQRLGGELAGVVLTSSPFRASGRRSTHGDSNLSDFDLGSIKVPLLLVHHREDACAICPYAEAQRRAGSHPLISVSGGMPPQSDPCEALSAHGYLGREEETVEAIVSWMLKKPYPGEIN